MSSFKELLRASFKSDDTEEWLDVHFTRPIGLVFALLWNIPMSLLYYQLS